MSNDEMISMQNIENLIFDVRGSQVMIDFHLAELYGVETKRLNEQVKRNQKRFPESFMFQLTSDEWENLQSQIATTKQNLNLRSQFATAKRRTLPFVFTEQGVAMLSAVLYSDIAIETSIVIMQAFAKMRAFLTQNASVFQRLENIEIKQLKTEEKIEQIFKAIEAKQPQSDKGIFFDGQIFDAYTFVCDLIKKAKNDIVLIDNFVDETTLAILSKRNNAVSAAIFTKTITRALMVDLEKHNAQLPPITINTFANSHDRFLLIDGTELYHIGASLKDLGKKWFAFSRMDSLADQLVIKLKTKNK